MAAGDSPRVLVVDDDPRFGAAITAFLEAAGIDVVGRAENGETGLALATILRPDMVTMDIDMPGMDGIEATRRLRQQNADALVIVLSGSESSDRVTATLAAGAVGHISKGRAPEELVPFIRAVWAARHLR